MFQPCPTCPVPEACDRLRAALTGWRGHAWKDGQYVDDIGEYFRAVLAGAAAPADADIAAELNRIASEMCGAPVVGPVVPASEPPACATCGDTGRIPGGNGYVEEVCTDCDANARELRALLRPSNQTPAAPAPEGREGRLTERIRDDGTIEGCVVETHYRPCIGAAACDGYLAVYADDGATDIETRVLDETLRELGYVRAADQPAAPASEPLAPNCDCTRQTGCRRQPGRWCVEQRFTRATGQTPATPDDGYVYGKHCWHCTTPTVCDTKGCEHAPGPAY